MRVPSLGQEDALEKNVATYSNILAWKISWMEEPDGLQSMGSQRVRHNCATEHRDKQGLLPTRQPGRSVILWGLSVISALITPLSHPPKGRAATEKTSRGWSRAGRRCSQLLGVRGWLQEGAEVGGASEGDQRGLPREGKS